VEREYAIDFVPTIKLDIVVGDQQTDSVIEGMKNAARTGTIGDGKILVSHMEQGIRIRRSEIDVDAIQCLEWRSQTDDDTRT